MPVIQGESPGNLQATYPFQIIFIRGDYTGAYVGESPGNLQATYPFQIIAVDHIPSLPRSNKGDTELLIWVDRFTEYAIAKASSSRPAQTVA
ncbi:LOW QUALITY PROTEIN: reverse transcriptase [Phytophthora megakarya]|uniref:Reverse transcriptase n=1 Tax=Phytophthora megakarya TaxID=4795 RepID=A0A225W108_9STRA|nr:LOW QUALITY PROTEIN: reverse transcriptase [Phytophthora megakarya]